MPASANLPPAHQRLPCRYIQCSNALVDCARDAPSFLSRIFVTVSVHKIIVLSLALEPRGCRRYPGVWKASAGIIIGREQATEQIHHFRLHLVGSFVLVAVSPPPPPLFRLRDDGHGLSEPKWTIHSSPQYQGRLQPETETGSGTTTTQTPLSTPPISQTRARDLQESG